MLSYQEFVDQVFGRAAAIVMGHVNMTVAQAVREHQYASMKTQRACLIDAHEAVEIEHEYCHIGNIKLIRTKSGHDCYLVS